MSTTYRRQETGAATAALMQVEVLHLATALFHTDASSAIDVALFTFDKNR